MECIGRVLENEGSEECHRYFACRKTVLEMLNDRGYDVVAHTNLTPSLSSFRSRFGEQPNPQTLGFCVSHVSDPSNTMQVVFAGTDYIRKGTVTEIFNQIVDRQNLKGLILVVQSRLTAFAKKDLESWHKDIGITVALGCPSLDRKVVNSGKRLRAYVGIDEGNVCSSCNLRGDCERAFVKAREDEGGRTVDVMRIILTYGLEPIIGSVENKLCLTKMVEESVRRLLKEIVEHSSKEENSNLPDSREVVIRHVHSNHQHKGKIDDPMVKQGDWICPKCNFMNFARNIRCLSCDSLFDERIKQLKEDNNHLPLKKGDWICNKCNFLNFAKNTRCLQCKERPSNRQLNPGEWECDSCNYLNFRRNMVCLKCDHRRPIVSKPSNSSIPPQQGDTDHYKNSKFAFVAHQDDRSDETPMVSERKNRIRDSRMWRFIEDGNEKHKCLNKSNDPSEFIDFPIVGGKTHLSGVQRREAYNNEFPNQCTRPSWQSETDDEFCSSDNLSTDDEFSSANNQSTDDEEMDEWFGKAKIER